MNRIQKATDDIIDKCMVNGDSGWAPQSGGKQAIAKGDTVILSLLGQTS